MSMIEMDEDNPDMEVLNNIAENLEYIKSIHYEICMIRNILEDIYKEISLETPKVQSEGR